MDGDPIGLCDVIFQSSLSNIRQGMWYRHDEASEKCTSTTVRGYLTQGMVKDGQIEEGGDFVWLPNS